MPIIKSAIKRVKQAKVRTVRNRVFRRRLHDVQKDFYTLIKDDKKAEAEKMLADVYKVLDTGTKKNIHHKKFAARMKSKAQKALTALKA